MSETYRPAEFVLAGHPDKLADAIADRIVEEAARRERRALCGVEVAVHRNQVFVTGRVAATAAETINIPGIVRDVFAEAGYGGRWYPAPADLQVTTDVCVGPLNHGEDAFRAFSDDQSIVTGYAIDLPGTNYLPPEQWIVHQIGRRLNQLRMDRPDLALGPDGKAMIVLADHDDELELAMLSVSLQQGIDGSTVALTRAIYDLATAVLMDATPAVPGLRQTVPDDLRVNSAGEFVVGGPDGDNGLSGKKLVVDAYGPRVPIGGGALSGKDFYKADRAGAILARRLAKAVVMTGAARDCIATLLLTPGADRATILTLMDSCGKSLPHDRWAQLLDLSLAGVGDRYATSRYLANIARWGHFTDPSLPWERISFDSIGSGQSCETATVATTQHDGSGAVRQSALR